MVARYGEMEFSLYWQEGNEVVEGVVNFKYLGRTLDQMDDDWPTVRQNIMRARFSWGRFGTLLQREGADPRVSAMFHRAAEQAVVCFGLETWILLAAVERRVEGAHTGFLRHIMGEQSQQIAEMTWVMPRAEEVQEAAGM